MSLEKRQTRSNGVESIVEEKKVGRKSLFLVRWKNQEEDSWEPAESLGEYGDLINDFKRVQSSKKQVKIIAEQEQPESQRKVRIRQRQSNSKSRQKSKQKLKTRNNKSSKKIQSKLEPNPRNSGRPKRNSEQQQSSRKSRGQTRQSVSPQPSSSDRPSIAPKASLSPEPTSSQRNKKSVQSKKSSKRNQVDEGDYEKGDTAYQIVEARELVREDDEERVKELLVQWKPREDQYIPKPSWAPYDSVKLYDGDKLIEFLERFQQSQILFKLQQTK